MNFITAVNFLKNEKIVFSIVAMAMFSLTVFAEKTTTVYGSGGVVTYPEGHKAICPLQNTAVCATIKECAASGNGKIEVGDCIEVTIEAGTEVGVVVEVRGEPAVGGNVIFR
ncbi:MAG: hypothetical protein HWD58_19870 [Bacteroidota bacterium]|nr:MAG: hypothetical protein HWD58_19870 [Bacteroidota bacterium]